MVGRPCAVVAWRSARFLTAASAARAQDLIGRGMRRQTARHGIGRIDVSVRQKSEMVPRDRVGKARGMSFRQREGPPGTSEGFAAASETTGVDARLLTSGAARHSRGSGPFLQPPEHFIWRQRAAGVSGRGLWGALCLSCGTSLERIAPESLTRRLSEFVHGHMSWRGRRTPPNPVNGG